MAKKPHPLDWIRPGVKVEYAGRVGTIKNTVLKNGVVIRAYILFRGETAMPETGKIGDLVMVKGEKNGRDKDD